MKIVVNTRFLLTNKLEGIGWFTYETLRRIVESHPQDEFIFLFDRPYDPVFIFAKNVTPIVLQPPARHPFLWYIWFEISVKRTLKRLKPDVFLSPDGYCTLQTDIPTVMVTHDIAHVHYAEQIPYLARKYYHYYIPKFLKAATRIIAVSNYTKRDIINSYQIASDKIAIACNGCRKDFQPLLETEKVTVRKQYAAGQEYFFYLGAMHPRKNIARLIQAFDHFKKETASPIKLLLGGRLAWQIAAIKNAYETAKYKEDIILLGYIDNAELPKILGAAMALTYVSLFEGFGIPILEAMHCEVPVLTSNVSSMPEVGGDAALLINPTSVTEIAAGMTRLSQEQTLRQKLIEKGKRQRQKFTWEIAAAVIYDNLQKSTLK
ncbi:MAG: glycosyltransferase family 4 protein [Saprospiraceae bacterium]